MRPREVYAAREEDLWILARTYTIPSTAHRGCSTATKIYRRRSLIRSRGALDQALRARFLDVGFTEEQLLEVIVGIAQKTITNYANALIRPTLDEKFASARWTPPA